MAATDTAVGYDLKGSLLEACSCGILCPCWVGEDPDQGTCDAFNAYHIESGTIRGVDVSGLNYVRVVHIPGNVLVPGSWQQVEFIDEKAKRRAGGGDQGRLRREARWSARRRCRADRQDDRHRAG
jgi:hypothetical protein